MSQQRLCGLRLSSVGVIAVLLYLIDHSLAALEGYVAGEDYPDFAEVPKGLSFTCDDKIPGYYADPETSCQVWHWCVPSIGGNVMYSFLCAPGTVFNQRSRVCDWFYKVDCQTSPAYYAINEDLYKDEAGNYIAGKKIVRSERIQIKSQPKPKRRIVVRRRRLTDKQTDTTDSTAFNVLPVNS
ncbi:uncharacterized protein LOC106715589 [Papilio machaon]|uniref:uncharacterized protein LOC106715589 n=1 Tax=Papilio machaon TaxID=76193 RepID=UPI001E663F5D|nr:uncharacterized protein LOC106715589 [Papilio machaon]